jgi:DNA processing protein
MSERLAWLEGLLLPVALRASMVQARLTGRPDPPEVTQVLEAHGGLRDRRQWAARVRESARACGAQVLVPTDPDFPRGCLQLRDPPAALFVRGDVAALHDERCVGVVGCRRGTERGRLAAERIGAGLARAGVCVASGLAYGVDGAAHRGCLAAAGRPIAVLGTGVDVVYPAGHLELQEEVARSGCLVSEYEPGAPPRKWQFLARNRLIAAVARALVVVEAGESSGALSTVDFALQLGREVMVVPGPVDCPHAAGCLELLHNGATPVRDAADVLDALGLPLPPPGAGAPLSLDATPRTPEEIAQRLGWTLARTLVALTDLELQGEARRTAGGRYVAPPAGAPSRAGTRSRAASPPRAQAAPRRRS